MRLFNNLTADKEATDLLDLRPNDRVWIQHHQSKEWYKQATVQESRHNGRAYELLDDQGKTYYRGRRFLRPVHRRNPDHEATVNRCYTTKTDEFADTAMESSKTSQSATLSFDKKATTPQGANVNVNVRVHRPRPEPINEPAGEDRRIPGTRRRGTEDSHWQQLQHLYNEELRRHGDALVLDGARLCAASIRMVEAQEVLPMPRPGKGGETRPAGSEVAQAPARQHREADREVREETRGGAKLKELPGSRWDDAQRAIILERCNTELRRLEDYMASEHLALPGSSNVVALSYAGGNDDIRRARLVRERQSHKTADRMERTQSQDVDASTWAHDCLLYTSPSPRDRQKSRMPSSA